MADNTDPEHVFLRYYILFTAFLGFLGYVTLNLKNPGMRDNYAITHRAQFTPVAARSLGVWCLLSMILRYGAWHFWGEKGWYDACMVSLAVPLWHYGVEKAVFGSVKWSQIFFAYGFDAPALIWMWIKREEVLGF